MQDLSIILDGVAAAEDSTATANGFRNSQPNHTTWGLAGRFLATG
jgi:hypothetical protein